MTNNPTIETRPDLPKHDYSKTKEDRMLEHLKAAVELGYMIACPGSHDIVVKAFPDLFADEAQRDGVGEFISDEVNLDDNPMVSAGDEGYWVSAWLWAPWPEEDEEEEDEPDAEDQADLQEE